MTLKAILNESGNKKMLFKLSPEDEIKLKKMLFDMCCDIFDFCEQNNLTCVLGGGTALGAIRHHGFIPWDDDIDLNMPREDYNRFVDLFPNFYKGKYELFVPDGKHKAAALSMKIVIPNTLLEDIFHVGDEMKLGVNLDIFPIDNVPDNCIIRTIKGLASDILSKMVVSAYYYQIQSNAMKSLFSGSKKTRLIYKLRCFLGYLMSFKSYQWWFALFDSFVQTKTKSKYVTIPTGRMHYFGEMMTWDDIFPLKKVSFESKKFWVYRDVEHYLTMLYGDYMKLPPIEKQEKHFYTKVKLD